VTTYAGDTIVQQGKLRLGTPSLSDAGSVYLSNGTTLELHYSGATDYVHGPSAPARSSRARSSPEIAG